MSHFDADCRQAVLPHSPGPVRISLRYWLCWLTVTGVLLAIHREDMKPRGWDWLRASPNPQDQEVVGFVRVTAAVRLAICPFRALAICTVGLSLCNLFRIQRDFPAAPGQWLLVCLGTYSLGFEFSDSVLESAIWDWFADYPEVIYEHVHLSSLLHAVALGFTVVATTIAAWNLRWSWGWLAVNLLASIGTSLFFVTSIRFGTYRFTMLDMRLEDIGQILLLVAGLTMAIFATIEYVRNVNRDLLHWLGVAAAIAYMIPTFVEHSESWWAL